MKHKTKKDTLRKLGAFMLFTGYLTLYVLASTMDLEDETYNTSKMSIESSMDKKVETYTMNGFYYNDTLHTEDGNVWEYHAENVQGATPCTVYLNDKGTTRVEDDEIIRIGKLIK